jgi:hypothetical protein
MQSDLLGRQRLLDRLDRAERKMEASGDGKDRLSPELSQRAGEAVLRPERSAPTEAGTAYSTVMLSTSTA